MWSNVCCSKYSVSQVTTFKIHMKQNNAFTRLIYEEKHLPKYMRFGKCARFIRFLFYPICLLGIIMLLNMSSNFNTVDELCHQRAKCLYYCQTDNFPQLKCEEKNLEIVYNGNTYNEFFYYPHPDGHAKSKELSHLKLERMYHTCHEFVFHNSEYTFSEKDPNRQWKVHTCFKPCKKSNTEFEKGFTVDNREICKTEEEYDSGLLCVHPTQECEIYTRESQICFDNKLEICLDYMIILYAVIICCSLHTIFDAALLYSFQVTFKPTKLEIMFDPDLQEENESNPDKASEPTCSKVMQKCWSEMLAILIYSSMAFLGLWATVQQTETGKVLTCLVEFGIALCIDQIKSVPIQFVIWWTVIRRCGKFEPGNFEEWDDETIYQDEDLHQTSLYQFMRDTVRSFIEYQTIENFILYMTILLCLVIFTELALDSQGLITQETPSGVFLYHLFYYLNYILLLFFIIEIFLRLFATGFKFLSSFISVFDSIIVFISFGFQVANLDFSFIALLRILRLVKVGTEMKKQADKKRAYLEMIKQKKKQSSGMSSYIERVLDFLEKLLNNKDIKKQLLEDIEWAIDTIGKNKLNTAADKSFVFDEKRPEIRAWVDLINHKAIPKKLEDIKRLQELEEQEKKKKHKKGKRHAEYHQEEKHGQLDVKQAGQKQNKNIIRSNINIEQDVEDYLFIQIADELQEQGQDGIYQALGGSSGEQWEEISFNVLEYHDRMQDNALPFMFYRICKFHDFYCKFNFSMEACYKLCLEINKGYPEANGYHNQMHIIDSLQAMHFFMSVCNLQTQAQLKPLDVFSCFLANLIHDYEHPGYTNQFIVRTKHPIAGRYSDFCVLENHSIASAFNLILNNPSQNILNNLQIDDYLESRKMIIEIVLNTEMSRHFFLMTSLKTKLGNNLNLESLKDRILILSVTLRCCDQFKVCRTNQAVFQKWMDNMFAEFHKQGDMERTLELPISKFMDRQITTNKEKVYLSYLRVICAPLLTTLMILIQEEDINQQLFKDGIEKNKRLLDSKIDENTGK